MKEKVRRRREAHYKQMPDWYWIYGLHDAKIKSVSELILEPNWKSKERSYNCLEFCIDCSGALYESNITKISLFNYKIKACEGGISWYGDTWWMYDELTQTPNGFTLTLTTENIKGNRKSLTVLFEAAEVLRN